MKRLIIINSIILSLLTSCDKVCFDKPQPINSKTINKIPRKYRGLWVDKNHNDTVSIESRIIWCTETAEFNEKLEKIDTSKKYIRTDKKIYKTKNNTYDNGYKYFIKDNELFASKKNYQRFSVNDELILKKVNDYLIINYRMQNDFWVTFYLEKLKDGTIIIRHNKVEDLSIIEKVKFLQLRHQHGDSYYEANMNNENIIRLIENNGFSDTLSILKPEEKIK